MNHHETCHECRTPSTALISENVLGDSRKWCDPCFADFNNRRYWAQKKSGEIKIPKPGDAASGLCYRCGFLSEKGVFRVVKRTTNSNGKKTWVCWRCDNERPTLAKWS